ncbi:MULTISPECIES: DUF6388 family protein [Pseudomonas]|uniref:DUF6388 family protein n=1 Tax=Pseudomonas TaxID=286 RepID=UPI00070FC5B2|nr:MULTISPECIES: DUF6388 family protein [Pseudomonas]KQW19741.1 hypothetical protein ASC85_07780 [Pseudomonas sp. Root401]PWD01924.1 hypothetical protein CX658_18360 [Pseudomonas amygdali pv. lachrymans]WHS57317.1 DUF6388 family protein [Pseudomonas brassicacearum]WNZ87601.1 DUF6388 family protein [Pseudomonas sp. P108]
MTVEQRHNAAMEKFFAEHPHLLAEIQSVKPAVIEACGLTVSEYREQQRSVVFFEAARRQGLDVTELVIRLVATSPEQAQEWRLDHQRKLAEALGMDWDEYRTLNRIAD